MSYTFQYSNNKFLKVVEFILKITIMFLSITQIIKVTLFSLLASLILQYGIKNVKIEELEFDWIDIQFDWIDIQFVILILLVLAQINLIFNLISERIYNNFESLKTIIKEKDRKINQLNKDIAELNKKLVNEKLVNEKLVNEKLVKQ